MLCTGQIVITITITLQVDIYNTGMDVGVCV